MILRRTTGARIAAVLFAYALAAMLGSLAMFIASRPVAESRVRDAIEREHAVLAPIAARLAPNDFANLIADRSISGAPRGAEYRLTSANGVRLAGRIPDSVTASDVRLGYVRFNLVIPLGARVAPRHMLGGETRYANGTRLMVAYDVDAEVAGALRVLWPVTLAVVLTAFAGIAVALVFARRGELQIRGASKVLAQILDGDLSHRLPDWPGTGFSGFAREFNVALERIEQLTVAMRAVADSTAHDLRAPLNRLRAALEYALIGEADPARLGAAVERALVELERVEMTLEALLRIALAEAGTASRAAVDVTAVVLDIIELYRPLAEHKGQVLDGHIEPGLVVNGNGQLLAQAIANLIDNGIKYTPHAGRIEVHAQRRQDEVAVIVSDSGPGIAAADRGRALERSRRLANAVGTPGSGLGLALVAAVMRLHGGTIELDDGRPGLVVRLLLRVS